MRQGEEIPHHPHPRMSVFQVLLVVGGQAPKAIRSVEAYDLKQEKWLTLSEMPVKRCR